MINMMNIVNKEALSDYKKLFDFENVDDFIEKGLSLGKDRFKAVYLFTLTDVNDVEHPLYVGMSSRFYGRMRDYARPPQIQAINDIKIQMEIKCLQDNTKYFSVYYRQVDVERRKQLHGLENEAIKCINPYFNRKETLTAEEKKECKGIDEQVLKLFWEKQNIKSKAKLRKNRE